MSEEKIARIKEFQDAYRKTCQKPQKSFWQKLISKLNKKFNFEPKVKTYWSSAKEVGIFEVETVKEPTEMSKRQLDAEFKKYFEFKNIASKRTDRENSVAEAYKNPIEAYKAIEDGNLVGTDILIAADYPLDDAIISAIKTILFKAQEKQLLDESKDQVVE